MSDFQVGDIVATNEGVPGNKPFLAARVTQAPEKVIDNPNLWMVLVEFDSPQGLQKSLVYTHNLVLVARRGDYVCGKNHDGTVRHGRYVDHGVGTACIATADGEKLHYSFDRVRKSLPIVKVVVKCDDRVVAKSIAWAMQEALRKQLGLSRVSGFGSPDTNVAHDHPIVVTYEENR